MVSFENFVKSMPPSLSELKVTPSFCFPFKIPDNPTATNIYCGLYRSLSSQTSSTLTLVFHHLVLCNCIDLVTLFPAFTNSHAFQSLAISLLIKFKKRKNIFCFDKGVLVEEHYAYI